MDCKQKSHRGYVQVAFGLACLLSAAIPAFAQEGAKPATEKWRPKDGVYAGSSNFYSKCRDAPDLFLELAKKTLSAGGEESCKIVKLADAGPGTISLDATCTDIERETPYKKLILLKKIDGKTIVWQATADTTLKFAYPGVRVSYCPEGVQRMRIEAKKHK